MPVGAEGVQLLRRGRDGLPPGRRWVGKAIRVMEAVEESEAGDPGVSTAKLNLAQQDVGGPLTVRFAQEQLKVGVVRSGPRVRKQPATAQTLAVRDHQLNGGAPISQRPLDGRHPIDPQTSSIRL